MSDLGGVNSTTEDRLTNESATSSSGDPIPTWIMWFGLIVMVGAPLAYAMMTFMGPDLGVVTLADGSQAETGLFKYAVRNVAAVAVTGFALYKRSAAMLLLVFLMRFATEAGDLLNGLLFGNLDAAGIAGLVGMMVLLAFVPYAIAIKQLWPMVR